MIYLWGKEFFEELMLNYLWGKEFFEELMLNYLWSKRSFLQNWMGGKNRELKRYLNYLPHNNLTKKRKE